MYFSFIWEKMNLQVIYVKDSLQVSLGICDCLVMCDGVVCGLAVKC